MLGYVPYRLWGRRRGAMGGEQRKAQTVNVWNIPALYALYRGDSLLYVGQTDRLGYRLLEHHRNDHLAGRWDTFSWLSPLELEVDGRRKTVSLPPRWPQKLDGPKRAEFLDEMEALLVLFGRPLENRAEPNHYATWLSQSRSEHAEESNDEVIFRLAADVAFLRRGLLSKARSGRDG